jgi:hypothetical protein
VEVFAGTFEDAVDAMLLTQNRIILDVDQRFVAIDKDATPPGTQQTLFDYTGSELDIAFSQGDKIYYTLFSSDPDLDTLELSAHVMDELGNGLEGYAQSAWIGIAFDAIAANGAGDLAYGLLAQGYTSSTLTDGFIGATLRGRRFSDGATLDLGVLDRPGIPAYFGFLTGVGVTFQPGLDQTDDVFDVFALDIEEGRFRYLTDTPDRSEEPVFPHYRSEELVF